MPARPSAVRAASMPHQADDSRPETTVEGPCRPRGVRRRVFTPKAACVMFFLVAAPPNFVAAAVAQVGVGPRGVVHFRAWAKLPKVENVDANNVSIEGPRCHSADRAGPAAAWVHDGRSQIYLLVVVLESCSSRNRRTMARRRPHQPHQPPAHDFDAMGAAAKATEGPCSRNGPTGGGNALGKKENHKKQTHTVINAAAAAGARSPSAGTADQVTAYARADEAIPNCLLSQELAAASTAYQPLSARFDRLPGSIGPSRSC